jgi:hypothetical protein
MFNTLLGNVSSRLNGNALWFNKMIVAPSVFGSGIQSTQLFGYIYQNQFGQQIISLTQNLNAFSLNIETNLGYLTTSSGVTVNCLGLLSQLNSCIGTLDSGNSLSGQTTQSSTITSNNSIVQNLSCYSTQLSSGLSSQYIAISNLGASFSTIYSSGQCLITIQPSTSSLQSSSSTALGYLSIGQSALSAQYQILTSQQYIQINGNVSSAQSQSLSSQSYVSVGNAGQSLQANYSLANGYLTLSLPAYSLQNNSLSASQSLNIPISSSSLQNSKLTGSKDSGISPLVKSSQLNNGIAYTAISVGLAATTSQMFYLSSLYSIIMQFNGQANQTQISLGLIGTPQSMISGQFIQISSASCNPSITNTILGASLNTGSSQANQNISMPLFVISKCIQASVVSSSIQILPLVSATQTSNAISQASISMSFNVTSLDVNSMNGSLTTGTGQSISVNGQSLQNNASLGILGISSSFNGSSNQASNQAANIGLIISNQAKSLQQQTGNGSINAVTMVGSVNQKQSNYGNAAIKNTMSGSSNVYSLFTGQQYQNILALGASKATYNTSGLLVIGGEVIHIKQENILNIKQRDRIVSISRERTLKVA